MIRAADQGGVRTPANGLCERAEYAVRTTRSDVAALAKQDAQLLVYELQVHQMELEMQNEALRGAEIELEASHAQYRELFDCAPAGYLVLDATASIVRANMAASTLLGVPLDRLKGQPLIAFAVDERS
jgi:PAS domain-containing protein